MEDPIEVTAPVTEQLWAAARTIAVAGGTYALGRGWIAQDTMMLLGSVAAVLWGVVGGQLKTWERSRKLVNMASVLPDEIARLR